MELIVAIFILSVIMLASVSVFANVILARKNSMKNLNNISAGRDVIQTMAKNMRVSSQLNYVTAGNNKSIYFFNSARGLCVSYLFSNGSLFSDTAAPGGPANVDCSTVSVTYNYIAMLDPDVSVDGSFLITPTNSVGPSKVIGRGTINMVIDGKDSLQTTVSFFDYIGIIN